MKVLRGAAVALAVACLITAASALYGEDPSAYGVDASFGEIIYLERLNAAVRFDPAPVIVANWRSTYDQVIVEEIASTKSRYALFVDDSRRRADIAIRGTVNLRNTAFDLEFAKSRSERLGINLHSGFEKFAAAIYADLRPRLPKGYSLRVAGHSMGAAEAIILGMMLADEGWSVEKVLASAPPKVTDAEGWARFPRLEVIRIVCPYDPVPFLPPRSLLYRRNPYIQGGKILMPLDGDRFAVLDGSYCDDLPEVGRRAFAKGRRFAAALHMLPAYLDRLLDKDGGAARVDVANWGYYATADKRN